MLDFKSPKANGFGVNAAKWLMPLMMRFSFKELKPNIDEASIEKLKAIEGYPTVLVPNHADYADAYMMFSLSKYMGETFYYMTAREMFNEGVFRRFRSFFMQRLGAYSVVRGTVDRESFRTARGLLKAAKHPLVIFAEGGVSRQNDTVMPFESGVVQLCFWALDDMKRANAIKPLYVVSIGIKYIYDQELWAQIETALAKLERRILPQNSTPPADRYDRLRMLESAVVSTLEKEYKFKGDAGGSLNDRIQRLREHILSKVEEFMGVEPEAESIPRKRVRTLKNLIDAELYSEPHEMTDYEEKVCEQRLNEFQQFYSDLNRLLNFIAIYDGYVDEKRSQERFLEVIARLEIEVFGSSKPKGPRTAFIRIATPKNLLDVYETYRKEKRRTTQRITLELETEVQDLISSMVSLSFGNSSLS